MQPLRRVAALLAAALSGVLLSGTLADCAGEAPCRFDSDCVQSYCSNGTCVQDCATAADCPTGYACNQVAQCQANTGDGAAPGVDARADHHASTDAAADAPASSRDAAPPRETGAADTGHDAMKLPDGAGHPDALMHIDAADASGPRKTVFDLCASDSECTSPLLCRAMYVGGAARCTPPCTTTDECMESTRCVTVGSEEYCVLSDIGRTCTAATTCNFACLTAQEYCTMPCTTGSDCPNGYGCQAVGTPPQSVCVKAEAPCSATDTSACIAAAACDTSATLVVAGCTLACTTAADCPQRAAGLQPWTCDGLCRRPPDVFGPLQQGATPAQYACDSADVVVNVCNDAEHIDFASFTIPAAPAVSCTATTTTSGAAGDSCLDSCLYQGGCAFGFACSAVGSVGADSRIGLCLPALSGGEIGAACSADGDCFFGYCDLGLQHLLARLHGGRSLHDRLDVRRVGDDPRRGAPVQAMPVRAGTRSSCSGAGHSLPASARRGLPGQAVP